MSSDLILVHGLFTQAGTSAARDTGAERARRSRAFAERGAALGVREYDCVDGSKKAMANRLLRLARGTAPAVDVVEIIGLDAASFRASLLQEPTRAHWREMASCAPYGFDASRSFILIGAPLQLLEGSAGGQRVIWFGRGLAELSEAEFVAHYTGHHGPLVAGHAKHLGLRRYRQVPTGEAALCEALRDLGLGQASAPAVFAELVVGPPRLTLGSLRARRQATREIKIDEQRHIDFGRSMLLLA